jgi:hypothetical protein
MFRPQAPIAALTTYWDYFSRQLVHYNSPLLATSILCIVELAILNLLALFATRLPGTSHWGLLLTLDGLILAHASAAEIVC